LSEEEARGEDPGIESYITLPSDVEGLDQEEEEGTGN
jgi:hypothetical protein